MFQNNTVKLDFEYFVHLFEEYYLSDDASSLGAGDSSLGPGSASDSLASRQCY